MVRTGEGALIPQELALDQVIGKMRRGRLGEGRERPTGDESAARLLAYRFRLNQGQAVQALGCSLVLRAGGRLGVGGRRF